jgi:hypothetical protein
VIDSADLKDKTTIKLALHSIPAADTHLRVIARGTGATPLLAADDLSPLGAPGVGGADDGVDFVQMIARSA